MSKTRGDKHAASDQMNPPRVTRSLALQVILLVRDGLSRLPHQFEYSSVLLPNTPGSHLLSCRRWWGWGLCRLFQPQLCLPWSPARKHSLGCGSGTGGRLRQWQAPSGAVCFTHLFLPRSQTPLLQTTLTQRDGGDLAEKRLPMAKASTSDLPSAPRAPPS